MSDAGEPQGWWAWLKALAFELFKDVGAHVAVQSAVSVVARYDPDMTTQQRDQLHTMMLRCYYAWKQGKPVQPLMRGVLALVVSDPDKAQQLFANIVAMFNAGASADAGSSGGGGGGNAHDASYFPPPPAKAPEPAPAKQPAAGDAKHSAKPSASSGGSAASGKPSSSTGGATASATTASGTSGTKPPEPSAPPLSPSHGGSAAAGQPSAPPLDDSKDSKKPAAAPAKPPKSAQETAEELLLGVYGIAPAKLKALPGGLYPALVTALRDNPTCSITLDDLVSDSTGRLLPGVSVLFQFGQGKYFAFLYRTTALDEWFRSKSGGATNPATRTPVDVRTQRFQLS